MKATSITSRNRNTFSKAIARNIYGVAEEEAYNSRASSRSRVTGDQIFDNASAILEQIQKELVAIIDKEHMGQE